MQMILKMKGKEHEMNRYLLLGLAVAVLAAGAGAEERIIVGHGPAVEVIDARSLTTLATGTVGPGNTIGVAVSSDRRHALVTEDSGGRIPTSPSLVVLDLTKPTLPVVARLAPGFPVRRVMTVPGGRLAIASALNGSLMSATLIFIDMTASPPGVSTTLVTSATGDFDVTPDGATAYVSDSLNNVIALIDLTQTPPSPIGSIAAPPGMVSIRVSPDGRRLVAIHQPNLQFLAARVWDLAAPHQPQLIGDVQAQAAAAPVQPVYDPGNRFVAAVATVLFNPSFLILFDTHSPKPANLYMLSAGAFNMQGLTITRDGNRAFLAVSERHKPASIREVDLTNPALPAFTNRVMLRFYEAHQLLAFGELHAQGPALPGRSYPLNLSVPTRPGRPYLMAASLTTAPGIPAGNNRIVPLNPDALFGASLSLPGIFQNFTGVLDARGQAVGRIHIPAVGALSGLSFFVAAVVLDASQPLGVGTISNAERIRIR